MIFTGLTAQNKKSKKKEYFSEYSSVFYHNLFDFPLTQPELTRWQTPFKIEKNNTIITKKSGYFFLSGKESLITKRKLRKIASLKKLKYAKKVAKVLSFLPTIQMIGITGSLSMMNADNSSDIDFMIVTKKGTMWTTRVLANLILIVKGFSTRRFGDKNQKDKICLNLWLDESDLVWKDRNIFTAHEISQVLPILERDWTYQEFLRKNRWIKKYWPNGTVFVEHKKHKLNSSDPIQTIFRLIEPFAFISQKFYMRNKITNETISKTRAVFHPINLSKIVSRQFFRTP